MVSVAVVVADANVPVAVDLQYTVWVPRHRLSLARHDVLSLLLLDMPEHFRRVRPQLLNAYGWHGPPPGRGKDCLTRCRFYPSARSQTTTTELASSVNTLTLESRP